MKRGEVNVKQTFTHIQFVSIRVVDVARLIGRRAPTANVQTTTSSVIPILQTAIDTNSYKLHSTQDDKDSKEARAWKQVP